MFYLGLFTLQPSQGGGTEFSVASVRLSVPGWMSSNETSEFRQMDLTWEEAAELANDKGTKQNGVDVLPNAAIWMRYEL